MSMLAERRTKQKWSLNPRGKAWSEDSSKFGQKMLEKMGWSKGKGLGAKENGITEHVKISYKNDSKGMGFKETNDQWTEHDTNFNALLESLAGTSSPKPAPKISASLEQKSQNSRARVHYRKFTRGKDLSRASEKDLANIFGKKSFAPAPSPILQEKSEVEQPEIETIHPKNESLYSNGGSMLDYFKKKMPSFNKNNGYVVGSNGVLKKSYASDDDGEEEEKPAFAGFGFTKKRKSCNVEEEEEEKPEHIDFTPKKLKLEERKDSPFKKTKKLDNSLGLANPAFEPMSTKISIEKHGLNPIAEEDNNNEESFTSENVEIKTKKKKKRVEAIPESVAEDEVINCSEYEVKRKKKKREHKNEKSPENGISNENFSDSFQETSSNCEYEVKRKKKKTDLTVSEDNEIKRKKKKSKKPTADSENNCNFDNSTQSNGINNVNFLEQDDSTTVESASSSNCDYEVKRTKKKSKNKGKKAVEDLAIDNPNFDVSANNNDNQSDYVNDEFEVKRSTSNSSNSSELLSNSVNFEVKRKKKKKSLSNMIVQAHTNQNFQIEDAVTSSPTLFTNSFEVKRKKAPPASTATNPNFNDSLEQPPPAEDENFAFDLMLNVTSTPSIVKSAQPSSSSVKRRKSVRFSNVTQERIIPNNEDIRERNELFDINTFVIENGLKGNTDGCSPHQLHIDENCEAIAKKFDGFQAEIENDLNEAKAGFIGDVSSTPHGENEQLASGSCKLKFKYANFNVSNNYWMMKNKQVSHSRSSYKHLIKGDIVLGFNNTNLHQIEGYAANKTV